MHMSGFGNLVSPRERIDIELGKFPIAKKREHWLRVVQQMAWPLAARGRGVRLRNAGQFPYTISLCRVRGVVPPNAISLLPKRKPCRGV